MAHRSDITEGGAAEPASVSTVVTSGKSRSRMSTFFNRLYSRRGALTHKEFVWLAIYLLTLGKLFDGFVLVPVEIFNVINPVREANIFVKILIVLYAVLTHVILFLYPLFNISSKVLLNTYLKERGVSVVLIFTLLFISLHTFFLESGTFLYDYSGYLLCIVLIFFVYCISAVYSK